MSVQAKTYLDYAGLVTYDGKIKEWANSISQLGFKTVLKSTDGNSILFFKKANATITGENPDTADATITLGSSDLGTQIDKLDDIIPAVYDSTNKVYSITGLSNSFTTEEKANLVAAINALKTEADTNKTAIGTLGSLNTTNKTDLVTAINEILTDISNLDVTEFPLAEVNSNVVTIHGIKEADGKIAVGNTSTNDITLEEVAYTGAAEDVSYDNTTSSLTATNVQSAIDEIKTGLGTAAAADIATSAIQEESTDDNLVSAAQVASFVASEIADLEGAMHFRGVITRETGETDAEAIARVITDPESGDVVVMSDNAKEYIYSNSTVGWREVGDETEFVKKTTTIAGIDLQDNITKTELLTALNVEDGAEANIIESVKVNGSALTPDSNKAVNVTVAEGSSNGTVAVNGSDVAIHGLGSAAYTASTAYDAAGTAAAAIEALDTSSDVTIASYTTGTSGSADVITLQGSLAESDGIIEAGSADTITLSTITSAQINTLFT